MSDLLLDIGNSRLKWGVLENGEIRKTGHITQDSIQQHGLQSLTTKLPRSVDSVMASNVAGPSFATRLSGVIGAHCNCEVKFAHSEKRGWGIVNGYRQPRSLGVDRWVAMVGAWAEVSSACLVVDAGTALTLDVLDDDGKHLGGQIIPGADTMQQSLANATSDIPLVKRATKRDSGDMKMFALNTAAAVREGSQNAITGAVERAIQTLQSNAYEPTILLTGGGSSSILGSFDVAPLHRPNLVLQGLQHMLESAK